MPVHEDCLRTHLCRRAQRHGRMYSELARLVRRRRYHAALVGPPADDYRLSLQRWIEQLLHRDKEGVHINMKDGALRRHAEAILAHGRDYNLPPTRPIEVNPLLMRKSCLFVFLLLGLPLLSAAQQA